MNAPTGLTSSIEAIERATGELYRWTTETREFAAFSDSKRRAADIASGNPPPTLLLWHGAEDRVVGPEVAVALHRSLQPFYYEAGKEDRLRLVVAADASHNLAEPRALRSLRASVAQWFNQYL